MSSARTPTTLSDGTTCASQYLTEETFVAPARTTTPITFLCVVPGARVEASHAEVPIPVASCET